MQTDFPSLACCNYFCQELIRNLHVLLCIAPPSSLRIKKHNDLKMLCVDTNANTKMAEAGKNEVLKKSMSEKHSQCVRLETVRGRGLLHLEFLRRRVENHHFSDLLKVGLYKALEN